MAFRFGPFIAAGLLLMLPGAACADAAARLNAYLSGLDTMSSRFDQRLFDEQDNMIEQTSGTMLLDRPDRFRFEYTDPPQIIVGDGAKVWIHDRELAQVTVHTMDDALGSTPAVLLTSGQPVEERFRIEAIEAGGGFDWFGLEPKAEDASIARIRLAFADGELRRMEFVDQFGQTARIEFNDIRRHPAVPAHAFTFTPPEGVDIVGAEY